MSLKKNNHSWYYAPAAVAIFGLGLYIARKKNQVGVGDNVLDNRYVDITDSAPPVQPSLTLQVLDAELDAIKQKWIQLANDAADASPTSLPPSVVSAFLALKAKNPSWSTNALLNAVLPGE